HAKIVKEEIGGVAIYRIEVQPVSGFFNGCPGDGEILLRRIKELTW
ncbi:hypothetical protein TNCV_2199471, partial [Trichonephila clavipes]